jgi:hypothetical protein
MFPAPIPRRWIAEGFVCDEVKLEVVVEMGDSLGIAKDTALSPPVTPRKDECLYRISERGAIEGPGELREKVIELPNKGGLGRRKIGGA